MDSIMKWINSSDIVNWANKEAKDCQQNLPLLIRYLIRESVSEINSMRFPSGDATQYAGWDGILDVNESVEFIKKGISFWEFGTNEDFIKKANEDYDKRTEENKGYNIKESVFVFVTPRIWEDDKRKATQRKLSKLEWITEKKKDNKWSDIIVYDARDLEEWIQKCPTTAIWLSTHINKYAPNNIESAVDFWERWTYNPEYSFTPELVLSGRIQKINNIKEWLYKEHSSYILKSFTKEESIAFLIATILSLEENEKKYFLERCLIISDKEVFKKIIKIHKYHILINYFEDPDTIDIASFKGNYVFYPITPEDTISIPNDELGLLNHYDLSDGLNVLGFSYEKSHSLTRDSGRSLSVLRRLLNFKQHQPDWAKIENSIYLLTALLIGKWDENNENDKNTISKLLDKKYLEFITNLKKFIVCNDPPVYNIANKWGLISQYDVWFILAPFLTNHFLEKFLNIAYEIISETDPEFYLDEDERYKAQVLGAVRKYSNWLREGILNTIVLLSIYSEKKENKEFKNLVDEFVKKLLKGADEKRWYSVSSILPQLAEASPAIFLEYVDYSLEKSQPSILVLFREGKDPMFSRCNHAGLLWALESLAWDPRYLTQVTLILSKLDKYVDKESRWGNRPSSSLREIYLAWKPNTNATLEERLASIDVLISEDNDAAFNLLIKLMPVHSDISQPTYKPKWRGFPEYKNEERYKSDKYVAYSKYFEKLLGITGLDGNLLSKIIPKYDVICKNDRNKFYNYLEINFDNIKTGKIEMKNALRDLITRHRSFPEAPWVLPNTESESLEKLYNKIPTENIEVQYKWLFDECFPNLFDVNKMNHKEYGEKLKNERIIAIKDLYKSNNLEEIINFAENIKERRILGQTVSEAEVINKFEEITIIELLDKTDVLIDFAKGYCDYKIWNNNKEWIRNTLELMKEKKYNINIVVNFLLILYPSDETWNIVNEFESDIQILYWSKWTGFLIDLPKDTLTRGYKKLLEHKRYITAIESAGMNPRDLSNELIVEILKKGGAERAEEPFKSYCDPYNIANLFLELDNRNYNNEKVMLDLEWVYVSILSDDLWNRPPKLLHRKMSTNPNFYLKVIRAIYKPVDDLELEKQETKNLSEETIINRSQKASDLFKSFKIIPGQDEKNDIDYEKLKLWVDKVRTLCKKYKRESIGEYSIGKVLAYSIKEDMIIPESVCILIETLKNKNIEEGFFSCEVYNREFYIKEMYEGGGQEREITKKYKDMIKKINPKYQRIIKIIENIVKSYEYEAEREDREAEQGKMDNLF